MKTITFLILFICARPLLFSQENQVSSMEPDQSTITIDELLTKLDLGESITGKTLVMNQINFDFNSSTLTDQSTNYLNKIVKLMKALPNMNLVISGHTDNIGNDNTNLKLSKERALSVYNFLVENEIDPFRLNYNGYGSTKPIADNNTDEGRTINRRVEFNIKQNENVATGREIQDIIYLNDGTKIGAHHIREEGDQYVYYDFTTGTEHLISSSKIQSIKYSNGTNYNANYPPSSPQQTNLNNNWYNNESVDVIKDLFRLNGIYSTLGYRKWQVVADEIFFHFIDDSPSMDNTEKTVFLNSGGITFDIGLEWNQNKNDFLFGYKAYGGKTHGGMLNFGYGFRIIDHERFMLRANATLDWAWTKINLGRIENNGLYIQINKQQYYEESIRVRLRKKYSMISPGLILDIPLPYDETYVRFNAGYNLQLTSSRNETLQFMGLVDDETITETKTLSSANNATFLADGISTSKIPVKFSGLYFSIGAVIRSK